MRYLLFILLFAGCKNPEPIPLPSKSINTNKTRYFFIGYAIGGWQRGNITWVSQSGSLPTRKKLLESLHEAKNVLPFKSKDFIILSLYEFKNKEEFDAWDEDNSN